MTERKFVDYSRSYKDHSVYQIFYPLPLNKLLPEIVSNVVLSKFIKAGEILAYVRQGESANIPIQAPLNGTIVDIKPIHAENIKGKMIHIFSIKLCDHFPKDKQQTFNQNILIPKNNSILHTADLCAYCQVPIWFFYEKHQNQVTFKQLKKFFEKFDAEQFQWKVVLNEQFTKHTELGTTGDDSYSLNGTGKITYLHQFQKKQPSLQTIVLKYKNVVCKHEKISSGMCMFCLTDIKSFTNMNLKRYLFQFDLDYNRNLIVSGKALQDQATQFRNKLIKDRKVLLILDLDNTILHSISLRRVSEDMLNSVEDYAIIPPGQSFSSVYIQKTFVKFRPNFEYFLSKIVQIFEIFIYTKGTRLYAQEICRSVKQKYPHILNKTKNFLPHRIISRDEDPQLSKKSLQFIMPKNKEIMLVLDDRRDVWNHSPLCVFTRPFVFFYYVAITEDGKTKFQPVEWQRGGGTLEHKTNDLEQKFLKQLQQKIKEKQIENGQFIEKEEKQETEKKILQLKQQIREKQIKQSQVVVCVPEQLVHVCEKEKEMEEEQIQKQDQDQDENQQQNQKKQEYKEKEKQKKIQKEKILKLVEENQQEKSVLKQKQPVDQRNKNEVNNKISNIKIKNNQTNQNNRCLKNNSKVPDQFLITALFALRQAHSIFFQKIELADDEQKKQGKYTDLSLCFQQYKKSLLQNISAYFVMRDYKKTATFRRSQKLGLRAVENPSERIDVIIRPNNYFHGYSQNTMEIANKHYHQAVRKLKSMSQPKKIPIISQLWIDLCYEYNCCIEYSYFQPSDPYAKAIFTKEEQIYEATGQATVDISQKIKEIIKQSQKQTAMDQPPQNI